MRRLAQGFLLVMLVVSSISVWQPVGAQSEQTDSLAVIQQALRDFGRWWQRVIQPEAAKTVFSRGEDGAFIMGNPDAPMTLIEFTDFACPHCQRYQPIIEQFIETYVDTGRARLESRIFPTAGGQISAFAAATAECAEEQQAGAFWHARELLFQYAIAREYDDSLLWRLSDDLELDRSALLNCAVHAEQVARDIAFGRELGVTGTPAVLVRYGDGPAQFIELDGRTFNSGGPPFEVLSAAVELAEQQ